MRRHTFAAIVLALFVVTPAATAATPNATLKAQVRVQKAKVAKLQKQLATTKRRDAAKIAGLNATITAGVASMATLNGQVAALTAKAAALTVQVTAQSQGGLAAVLAGNPDDLWNAVAAIWQVFPNVGGICGYQKSTSTFTSTSFNHTAFDFDSYSACAP